jgi:hypothetical protein
VEFLREVRSRVVRLFFVFNKIDYLGERESQAALGLLNRVLSEQVGIEDRVTIFPGDPRLLRPRARRADATLLVTNLGILSAVDEPRIRPDIPSFGVNVVMCGHSALRLDLPSSEPLAGEARLALAEIEGKACSS